MTDAQREHWELLLEVDDLGRRLNRDEIEFVSGLIDGDREGTLTVGEMTRIRALHRRRVENMTDEDVDL